MSNTDSVEHEQPKEPEKHEPHPSEPMPEGEEQAPPGTGIMALVRWLLVAAMAGAVAVSVAHYTGFWSEAKAETLYYCPMHPDVVQHGPGECPICHMALVPDTGGKQKSDTIYYCPMHPDVKQHEPGECPICHMDLVPGKASGGEAEHAHDAPEPPPGLTTVELTDERIQRIGLRTAPVVRGELVPSIRTVGTVAAAEAGMAQVTARFAGWVETTAVTQTWQRVQKGQVLATLHSPDLIAAQQELLTALTWAESGTLPANASLAADARARLELLGLTAADIATLERTRTPLRTLQIRSPAHGFVVQRNAVKGSYVQPGAALFEIADLTTVWLLAEIYEHDLGRVAVGQRARLTLPAYPGQEWIGKVDFLTPIVDPGTRTLRVRMVVGNRDLKLKPGMFGDVVIELPAQEGLLAPREAVVDTGDSQYVFLARPGGRFEPRRITVGARVGEQVQLLPAADGAAVAEGDVVVTTANFLLDSESRLRAGLGERKEDKADKADKGDAAAKPAEPKAPVSGGHSPGHVH